MRIPIALAALTFATPLLAGAPWISVELPPNRSDPGTRGAFMVVRTYHHATPVQLIMRGEAHGLVAGRRLSVPLRYRSTHEPTAHAVDRTWDTAGVWVIDARAYNGHGEISAVVGVGADGEAAFVRVPLSVSGAPRTVSGREIDALLASLARGQTPAPLQAGLAGNEWRGLALMAALTVAGLGALGIVVRRVIQFAGRRHIFRAPVGTTGNVPAGG